MAKFDLRDYLSGKALKSIESVVASEDHSFSALLKASGLDPERDLRFQDFSGVDFRNTDMRGFDLTGADLRHALINHATLFDETTDLTDAKLDWLVGPSLEERAETYPGVDWGSVFEETSRSPTKLQLEIQIARTGSVPQLMSLFLPLKAFDRRLDDVTKETVIRHLQNQLNWNKSIDERDPERFNVDVTKEILFSSRHPLFFELNSDLIGSYGGQRKGDVLFVESKPDENELEKLSRLIAVFQKA